VEKENILRLILLPVEYIVDYEMKWRKEESSH
jgi:hypothetical protein